MLMTVFAWTLASQATATPTLRHQVDQAGDFLLLGNTLAQDCGGPAPVAGGSIGACGTNTSDNSVDAFWRADTASAAADVSINAADARTTARLVLPAGASVTYARLYWSAMSPDTTLGTTATLDGPGGQTLPVTADAVYGVVKGIRTWYQGTLDVTSFVVGQGQGPYRLGNIKSFEFRNLHNNDPFIAWSMVVFYSVPGAVQRNLALFDGLDVVNINSSAAIDISGFHVPNAGFDAKLGVIAYEGDKAFDGDSLVFNSAVLSDAENSATNFFNGSRTNLGVPVSIAGDLPQLSGASGSMSGTDLDVVDITAHVKAGDTMAHVEATSNGNDSYSLGAFVTSISTLRPDLSSATKVYANLTRQGGEIPKDVIEYTITVKNDGNDAAIATVLRDPLPAGITYLAGSLKAQLDPTVQAQSAVSDAAGDDAGEYDASSRTVVVRLGAGASASAGGVLAPGQEVVLRFRVTVDAAAVGMDVFNEATITAAGLAGNPPTDFKTTNAAFPVDECVTDKDCASAKPICANGTPHPWLCTAAPCVPKKEVCDGKDNDCDGQVDEALSMDCSNCLGEGSIECVNGKVQDCSAPPVLSIDECPGSEPQEMPVDEENVGDLGMRRGRIIDGCHCGASGDGASGLSSSGAVVLLSVLLVLVRRRFRR
ncbi:MAG: DUF11 domain-containing protein [Deltaproteobacteria bacterium]|nr:DUF11 domain-containing protein [Deltaproteobacteria bacterium]